MSRWFTGMSTVAMVSLLASCTQVTSGPRAWTEDDFVEHHLVLVDDVEVRSFYFGRHAEVMSEIGSHSQTHVMPLTWTLSPSGSLILEDYQGRLFVEWRIVEIKGGRYVLDDGHDWRIYRRIE